MTRVEWNVKRHGAALRGGGAYAAQLHRPRGERHPGAGVGGVDRGGGDRAAQDAPGMDVESPFAPNTFGFEPLTPRLFRFKAVTTDVRTVYQTTCVTTVKTTCVYLK